MKTVSLVTCIFLPIFLVLILSIGVQGTEYKEIDAKTIITQIEKGEDVNYTGYHIKGELDVSKIKLETIPYIREYKDSGDWYPRSENLPIVKGNITFENSYFEDPFIFIDVWFTGYADFYGATFNNYTDFNEATFNGETNFSGTAFNNYTDFYGATFNNYTDFNEATFNGETNFYRATFNNSAYFTEATFNDTSFGVATFNGETNFDIATFNNVYFGMATFNGDSNFYGATFNGDTCFTEATFSDTGFGEATFNGETNFDIATFNNFAYFGGMAFNNLAYFTRATFNNSAYFIAPDTSKNIITDGKTCAFFMKEYNDDSRYTDANNIYYNFRKKSQEDKALTEPSKLIDFFSWVTCGYGVRISHTLIFSVGIIISFACLYRQSTTVSVINSKNKRKPVKVYWKEPKIYRLSDETEKKSLISFFDALYFSIMVFTTLGSEWSPRDNYRKLVALEGVLGYIMLGIFLVTLSNVLRISSS